MADRPLRRYLPAGVRDRLRSVLPFAELNERIDRLERALNSRIDALETQLHESREEAWTRSRKRWRAAKPDADLTWAVEIGGDAFVAKAESYGAYGSGRNVVEIGPGYGRLLAAALERGVEFASYVGIDISAENVSYLRERFIQPEIEFVHADVEAARLERPIDSVISSLTFKHLYPSFEAALRNLGPQMRAGGRLVFDLIEGRRRYFEDDRVTYIRWYTRPEIEELLGATGFEPIAFDEVEHVPGLTRLLVVAERPQPQ
jgi:SAM-dependent methyltransferase